MNIIRNNISLNPQQCKKVQSVPFDLFSHLEIVFYRPIISYGSSVAGFIARYEPKIRAMKCQIFEMNVFNSLAFLQSCEADRQCSRSFHSFRIIHCSLSNMIFFVFFRKICMKFQKKRPMKFRMIYLYVYTGLEQRNTRSYHTFVLKLFE